MDKDTYTMCATFSRSMSADADVLRPKRATRKALVRQFVKELQEEAYNKGWMDGTFQVNSITIAGRTTTIKK